MLLNFDCYPKHLGAIFKETYEDIRLRRLAAKKAKDKLTDITLKYALNGFFAFATAPFEVNVPANLQ